MEGYTVILFYKFTPIADPAALAVEQRTLAEKYNLQGRMLIAPEGVNATFEGTNENVEAYKLAFRANELFREVSFKESAGTGAAFRKLEVRVRDEVVTLEAGTFDVKKETAPEITAEELEALFKTDEDFVVLDLRNDYEIEAGKFEKTVDPGLKNFRDLPAKLPELAHLKNKKVVTVCTGGIRCEKATCLLKREGFTNLYQLKDGIHTYMQEYPGSKFKGTLFVFDNRMVTPVVDTPNRTVVGACAFCDAPCEVFFNDDSVRPSRKVICCDSCITEHAELRTCV